VTETDFVRVDGPDPKGPIYFLPWKTGFATAQWLGLVAIKNWRCCYQVPDGIVSPSPERCVACVRDIESDVCRRASIDGAPSLVIGFSMGTVPATIIASRFGARLWSFASADRGELMIWSSPAARAVRRQAERNGYRLSDFSRCLAPINPISCLHRIHPESRFAVGLFDRFIPRERTERLVDRAMRRVPAGNVLRLPLGHFGVMAASPWIQRHWLAIDSNPARNPHGFPRHTLGDL